MWMTDVNNLLLGNRNGEHDDLHVEGLALQLKRGPTVAIWGHWHM